MTHWLLALLTLFAPADLQNERASINTMLNDWHRAARLADEDAYFAHCAGDDAVFMGTDATERWTAKEFRVWAHPYFERGTAWERALGAVGDLLASSFARLPQFFCYVVAPWIPSTAARSTVTCRPRAPESSPPSTWARCACGRPWCSRPWPG